MIHAEPSNIEDARGTIPEAEKRLSIKPMEEPEPFLRETQKFARDAQEAPRLRAEDARQELDAADRLRGRRLALADVLECMASPS